MDDHAPSSAFPQLSPRKFPRQARSQSTVEAILEGAARILRRRDTLTTNHVAQEAGVSIGSVYQYFPSAAAIVAALIDLHVGQEVEAVGVALRSSSLDASDTIANLVQAFVEAHAVDADLASALHYMAPQYGLSERLADIRNGQADAISNAIGRDPQSVRLAVAAVEGALLSCLADLAILDRNEVEAKLIAIATAVID